ncbi:hypothetical protein BV25DRAFT_1913042 [Artomyces pyxidatus]|uniref:Uncharacterized protein n=1 Tax=Artomyces pyxidatus TaxID=48021 RepID=A0ACB8TBT2_9AGAM|nr:hypothetical protein BV25DRAFT_1913042 [Artomyces pyxidatus]
MAAPAPPNEILGSLLLRTSTPAPDEKVLVYLERMQRESFAPSTDAGDDLQTARSPRSKLSNIPKSQLSGSSWRRDANGGYKQDRDEEEDMASDVQENAQSTLGSLVQRNGVHREPGPEDEPGPHYESYGSSFGNFGPLPPDSAFGESTPGKAAAIPLPTSAGAPSTKVRSSHPGSRASASQKAQSVASRARATEKEAVTALEDNIMASKLGSSATQANGNARAIPPRSHASPAPSGQSRATQRTRASEKPSTAYPPLPASQSGQSNIGSSSQMRPASHQRSHSRAPSLSPSDSPSQIKSHRPAVRSIGKEPSLAPVPQSATGSEAEGGSRQTRSQLNGEVRSQAGPSVMSNGNSRSQRPFSPYRHAPTDQDLLHAAIHGHSVASENERQRQMNGSPTKRSHRDQQGTPTPPRPQSPGSELDEDEAQLVEEILTRGAKTPRTSYAATTSVLDPQEFSHFHDMDLCVLLHQLDDPMQHEVVKRAVRKAVKGRVKRLGMKYDNEARPFFTIKQYRKSFHDHDPSVHLQPNYQLNFPEEPPEWAKEIMQKMILMQQRIEGLGPKIDSLKSSQAGSSLDERKYYTRPQPPSELYTQTPQTQTVNIQTHPTGTVAEESMYQPDTDMRIAESTHGQTLPGSMHHHDGSIHGMTEQEDYDEEEETEIGRHNGYGRGSTQGDTHTHGLSEYTNNRDSPGQQYLEEELYKLRVRRGGSQSAVSHKTWELAREDGQYDDEDDPDAQAAVTESGLPEIPDSNPGGYGDRRATSPPLPALPSDSSRRDVALPPGQVWQQQASDYSEPPSPPAWQRIHQRLLNWAIVWPLTELDTALNSTTRGNQVDEVALSIWSTQTYKRYVRSKMTDSPPGRVDRLFVPPNMADAISNAVFNGRHGDASGMLRELWHPFGLEGMPRLLIVLAKHRSDANHWVVHRFSLPDGTLTTYDSYPERCLPDGRVSSPGSGQGRPPPPRPPDDDEIANPVWSQPLGWWFAIRIAWPNAIYPSPDHLMQKMVRLHRPMQLGIDNSVAAAGIWRNLLMGSRAERSLDLERLRDLINTEVKNLRQRKLMGKLSIGAPRPNWEDMH